MARYHDRDAGARREAMSRRDFLKLAALSGLLAGCGPVARSAPPVPLPTPTPIPPTVAPAPSRRPDVFKMYPAGKSKVVHAVHPGAWATKALSPGVVRQMLDASITQLTGLSAAQEAWAALFSPADKVAIKVNTIGDSAYWTHPLLVMAVTDCLQEAGVPAEQIVIFDRQSLDLDFAHYTVNQGGPGVRCYGTDGKYTKGWKLADSDIGLSDIVLGCTALINMPILKNHSMAGFTFALKNHYGSFDRPSSFHYKSMPRAIAEVNALPPIKDRTRLVIGDALTICTTLQWAKALQGNSILMSFDPVAADTAGLRLLHQAMAPDGLDIKPTVELSQGWLTGAAQLGLGTNDEKNMELVELNLA